MSRIRKQPRRSNKKICQPIFRNIFLENDNYENVIPLRIMNKLTKVNEISIKNLE